MLVFFIKRLLNLRQAIFGRREPNQLAWGFALGGLIGIIPHGNLVAVLVVLMILSVKINHGMAMVTAFAMTLLAPYLDPQTHTVGLQVLTHPQLANFWAAAWQLPLVPWTSINNTVVLGSLLVGLTALLPSYLAAYQVFQRLAPRELATEAVADVSVGDSLTHDGRAIEAQPPTAAQPDSATPAGVADTGPIIIPLAAAVAVDAALTQVTRERATTDLPSGTTVHTRIEVVRLRPAGAAESIAAQESPATISLAEATGGGPAEATQQPKPMTETLNYLLRQLRDSREGRAA
jgi:uncharacterized protein (TIGR03546 family)